MRDVPIPKLIAAIIVLTVVTSVIMLIPNWNGEEASTAAPKIDTLLDVMIVLSSFVFSIVMVMLLYAVWKWRGETRGGDDGGGRPAATPRESAPAGVPQRRVPSSPGSFLVTPPPHQTS